MKFLGIIPARYASTRLEGKPLIDIAGKPMIQWVYERAHEVLDTVYVATDDERIEAAVADFGGQVVLTSKDHPTGTNRCLEAYNKIKHQYDEPFDVIINIQGDEPLLHVNQLRDVMNCFNDSKTDLATLVIPVDNNDDLNNESEVFVTFDKNMMALYFSRSVIPYIKGVARERWLENNTFYKHLGLYAYTPEALQEFAGLQQSNLELVEGLEQNRWLENGHKIKIAITEHQSIPVDTLDDLVRIRKVMGML
jgi:3-deoxy-manno-octulosonate cytidylyltransferase (CMP-KDO synthetase)